MLYRESHAKYIIQGLVYQRIYIQDKLVDK